ISLESRLQYEHRPRLGANERIMTVSVSRGLDDFEGQQYRDLSYQFKLIHSRYHEAFVRAIGFGVGRMMQPTPEYLRRPRLRDIPFDAPIPDAPSTQYRDWEAFWQAGQPKTLQQLYQSNRADFLDPVSFGAIIEPPLKVAGFIAHALHYRATA